jgi:hypothetical protein
MNYSNLQFLNTAVNFFHSNLRIQLQASFFIDNMIPGVFQFKSNLNTRTLIGIRSIFRIIVVSLSDNYYKSTVITNRNFIVN